MCSGIGKMGISSCGGSRVSMIAGKEVSRKLHWVPLLGVLLSLCKLLAPASAQELPVSSPEVVIGDQEVQTTWVSPELVNLADHYVASSLVELNGIEVVSMRGGAVSPLPGSTQTDQRAELVLLAWDSGKVLRRIDISITGPVNLLGASLASPRSDSTGVNEIFVGMPQHNLRQESCCNIGTGSCRMRFLVMFWATTSVRQS